MKRAVVYAVDVIGPLGFAGVFAALMWGQWAVVGFGVALGVLLAVFQVAEDRRFFRVEDTWAEWNETNAFPCQRDGFEK